MTLESQGTETYQSARKSQGNEGSETLRSPPGRSGQGSVGQRVRTSGAAAKRRADCGTRRASHGTAKLRATPRCERGGDISPISGHCRGARAQGVQHARAVSRPLQRLRARICRMYLSAEDGYQMCTSAGAPLWQPQISCGSGGVRALPDAAEDA